MYTAALITQIAVTAPAAFTWLAAYAQSFASDAGSVLITAAWQSALVVCALEIATRLMPRISAAHRFALWSSGFLLSLALPLFSFVHFGNTSATVLASSSAVTSAKAEPLLKLDASWGLVIALVWIAASLIRAAALAVHSLRLRRLWKTAEPVEISSSLGSHLKSVRQYDIAVCTTKLLDRPNVIGFFSPRILIPEWLMARLTPGELNQIVLHEAEHLRRGDDWTNLLQKFCLVLFPLNPALAWIEHRLCREREMACDEGVVRITNAPRAYAACLASLAERGLERRAEALSLGAWHRRSELVTRVHRILLQKGTMSTTAAGALLATVGSMLLAGSLEMSRCPQLVSFVPEQSTQALTQARQAQLDALLAREDAAKKAQFPASYRAVATRAILPERHFTLRTRKHIAPKTAPGAGATSEAASSEQVAKSEQIGDRLIQSQPVQQQWVVVTEWREVSSISRNPRTISDFEPATATAQPAPTAKGAENRASQSSPLTAYATAPSQSPDSKNVPTPQAHRFTVTQLILRVVPASPSSASTQPPTSMVRDGWFVIQL